VRVLRGRPDASLTYEATLARLEARGRFGIRLGLGRTRALLRAMGSPEAAVRGALIGGTNGKGSVQAIVSACLGAAGYRVGPTPKPHLEDYRERIVVAGRPIERDAFAALLEEVLDVADATAARLGPPTEFEVLTVAAFTWFARQAVDLAVVEVGLGGRLDATNAWDGGVAAITNVQLDHMDRLGSTLEAIGREKAAIIKSGDRAVTGAEGPGLAVIRRRAGRLGVPLLEAPQLDVLRMDRRGLRLHHPRLGELRLGLLGRHQAANAGVALGILDQLQAARLARLPEAAIRRGLAEVRWPGRLELVEPATGPAAGLQILLDGAHNEAGCAALAAAVDELVPSLAPGRATLLLGIMADKAIGPMLAALRRSRVVDEAEVVATAVGAPRALAPVELAVAWQGAGRVDAGSPPAAAAPMPEGLDLALERARANGGPLVVAGSLYLVGEVRGRTMDPVAPGLVD
jgi:dihydrofolate synthase/folylpolyglutamate synthase